MERRASARSGPAAQVVQANLQAAMPVRPLPRPALRARAVSPAIGRFDRPPIHRGALEPAPAAGTAAPNDAMATDASHATVRLPAPPAPPAGKLPPQLPPLPILCTDAHGTHARTHNLPPTALWGRPLRLPLLHKSSTPRRPRSSPRRRSGRCLPAAAPAHAHSDARPAFDPATAAARP